MIAEMPGMPAERALGLGRHGEGCATQLTTPAMLRVPAMLRGA